MARRLFTFDFSKYRFLYDDIDHDFRVFREDEDVTQHVMNNPLLDLLLAYNNLYEKSFANKNTMYRGIMRSDKIDIDAAVDNERNTIQFNIKGVNKGFKELLADDIFNYINKRVTYYMRNE